MSKIPRALAFEAARRERDRLLAERRRELRRQEPERREIEARLRALEAELDPLAKALHAQDEVLSSLWSTALVDWKISRASRWPSGQLHLASRVRFGSSWFSTAVWLRVVLFGAPGAPPTWTVRVGAHGLGGFQEHALGPAGDDPEEEWELRSREAERLAEAAGFWLSRGLEWREPAEEES